MTDAKINITYPVFPDHTTPTGALPNERGAQACWYFYLLAQKNKEKVGDSIEDQFGLLEGDPWHTKHYEQIARTVAMIYQLESPAEFAKFWRYVQQEAYVCGLPTPDREYMVIQVGRLIS